MSFSFASFAVIKLFRQPTNKEERFGTPFRGQGAEKVRDGGLNGRIL